MLSRNPHIQSWLSQFDFEDSLTARNFLDSLEYVKTERLCSELEAALVEIILEGEKVAIFPIRELIDKEECYFPRNVSDLQKYYDNQGEKIDSKSLALFKSKVEKGVVSKGDIEKFCPVVLNPAAYPGSESLISSIITQLKRQYRNRVVTGKSSETCPSIYDLRKEKCRKFILVDDVIGSGGRVKKFIESLSRNKTINSWISGNFVQVIVVSFMQSEESKTVLKNIKQKVNFKSSETFPTFYDFNEEEVVKYSYIINKYTDKKERIPFGYGNTYGRAIFEHSVPNNTPAILWRPVKKWSPGGSVGSSLTSWNALFPNRAMPSEIKSTERKKVTAMASMRIRMCNILNVIATEPSLKTNRELSRFLGWDLSEVREMFLRLESLGLVDKDHKLTSSGESELDYLLREDNEIVFNEENYYPSA